MLFELTDVTRLITFLIRIILAWVAKSVPRFAMCDVLRKLVPSVPFNKLGKHP